MDWKIILEFLIVLAAIALGARTGGIGFGLWGAVGLTVMTFVLGLSPGEIPIDVLFIILEAVTAAAVMEAAGFGLVGRTRNPSLSTTNYDRSATGHLEVDVSFQYKTQCKKRKTGRKVFLSSTPTSLGLGKRNKIGFESEPMIFAT